jgi:hypothetical protein
MGNAESLTGVQQWLLMYMMAKCPFDLVDIMLAEIEDAIMDGMGMTRQQPFAHWISWLLSRLEAQWYIGMLESLKFVFLTYRPSMPGDKRRGPRGMRRAEETLQARAAAEAVMDEAARQDATLAAVEAPLPQYFATDDESSSDDEEFVPAPDTEPVFRVRRSHDDEAGGSTLPGQREAESPVPTILAAQVTQPDQLTTLISAMAAQTQATLQVQQEMQAQFQQYQGSQQVILKGIRQQQEAQRQQMLQHQMLTSQMFTFISGCLGQLFQQSGLQLPEPPTTTELQADPTAPLPPADGFVKVPVSTFPKTPLLQTGAFAVPQTMTPQAAVTTSFLAQLQMTTPASSQLVSPLTTGALVFETPARTTLPSPPGSSPLPTFTTPRAEGLGQEDHYLRAITEQISSALASDTVPPAPEATTAPSTMTVAPPPPPPGSSSPAWDILGEDTDDDDASGFSVRPSRVISTSPPDPSSPPQA